MMLKALTALLIAGTLQTPVEAFKKEMIPLQVETDKLIGETGARVLLASKAALIEGHGVVVSLEVALEPPLSILFGGGSVSPAEVRANVAARQKAIKDKITAMLKQRVVAMESIGADDALTVVVHLFNAHTRDVPNLPRQVIFSVKKSNPQQVAVREI